MTRNGCVGLLLLVAGCNMDDDKSSEGIAQASLSGRRCEEEAKRACDDARRSRGSDDDGDRAYGHRYVDCSVEAHECTCAAEKDCLDVARRKLGTACDRRRDSRKRVSQEMLDEIAHCHKLCTGESFDLTTCAEEVPVREELHGKEREIAYQVDIGSYCGAPGVSDCTNRLIARANVDYTAAAMQVLSKRMTPAQYLALSRDRTRKLRSAEEDGRRAFKLCTAQDSDGDWVPDSVDRCPRTPDLAATDDAGCPLTTLPPAPSAQDVDELLTKMHFAVNPRCNGSPVPERVPAGGFYWPAFPERGTFILSGAVTNQPVGCPIWYEFDIEETSGSDVGHRYSVAFMDREANTDLVQLGRPVPAGLIQFNPRPGDPRPDRVRLAQTGFHAGIRYRVRAMNGEGLRGQWSDWKVSDKGSCLALGFKCGTR